jgi:hypothetical protein
VKDLYRSPEADPIAAQRLETDWFQAVDSAAAQALVKLNEPGLRHVPGTEARAWTLFVLSLLHRTPAYLFAMKQAGERMLRSMLPSLKQTYGREPDEVERYIKTFSSDRAEQTVLRNLPHLIANRSISETLFSLHWVLVNIPEGGPDVLLSDDPIARTNGLKTERGHLAMPLSPRRLLIGAWQAEFAAHLLSDSPVRLARGMNVSTVEGARHFVAARDTRQDRFVRNRFGKSPRSGIMERVAVG